MTAWCRPAGALAAATTGPVRWPGQEQPGSGLPRPAQDPEWVRRSAREILARAEFRPVHRSLILRLLDEIDRLINSALNQLAKGPGSVAGLLVLVALVAVLGVLAVRLARRLPREPSRSVVIDERVGRSASDWRADAARHEAEGRWREALRCRYRSLIADLAARNVVAEVPGRTSGEYRREVVVAIPGVAADFGAATDLFERAWYGHARTGSDDSARLAELAGRVMVGVS